MTDFVARAELEDLLAHLRKKVERLEQHDAEARESIESFRLWSIIQSARIRQLETWLLGVLPDEQADVIRGQREAQDHGAEPTRLDRAKALCAHLLVCGHSARSLLDVMDDVDREHDTTGADDGAQQSTVSGDAGGVHLWRLDDVVFVCRTTRDGESSSFALSTWPTLEAARQHAATIDGTPSPVNRVVRRATVSVGRVARVDLLANTVAAIAEERPLDAMPVGARMPGLTVIVASSARDESPTHLL